MAFTHVLFDLDGTLTDSRPGILAAFRHGLAAHGLAEPAGGLDFVLGPPLVDSFTAICGDPALARRCVLAYREYYDAGGMFENSVYPGIPGLLDALLSAGLRLGVATSKPEPYAVRILDHFGLSARFDTIGGADMAGPVQHKPDVLRRVLSRLRLDPARALMVGDRCYDIDGAHAVGAACAGVLYGYGTREELEKADFLCEVPGDVLAAALA